MKITKIKVKNYRLLKDFELDLEEELSLAIGKNNCGKTSLLSILDKFIGAKASSNAFSYDDFNIDFQKELRNKVESTEEQQYSFLGISLRLFIKYDESDNLSNISKVMMDLDPNNKTVILAFEYTLLEDDFRRLRADFKEYQKKITFNTTQTQDASELESETKNIFTDFIKSNLRRYFRIFKKSVGFDISTSTEIDEDFVDLIKEGVSIDNIINFKVISAKRNVSNNDSDKTLSILSSKYYEKKEETETESQEIQKFKEALCTTDQHLDKIYNGLFDKVIKKVEKFGGVKEGDSIIKIISTLQHQELLKGNTTVMYAHDEEHSLPENYNGLGYLNLISIIFEIEMLLSEFRKENKVNESPADINLLFIEEPEAHTHPQMQYVFIKNIKDILTKASKGEDGTAFNLQTLITTHSSHITAESKFNDIKYFYKVDSNKVVAKNLKDLEKEYEKNGQKKNFKFLKQYLTLHRAELFFADKVIFIEGDTERILLPAMMKKIDLEYENNPLLSQNLSIVEVGAYSQIFEKFIDFIGVKSLIITDIDSGKKEGNKCKVSDSQATLTTNSSLMFFFEQQLSELKDASTQINDLEYLVTLPFDKKKLQKNQLSKKWEQSSNGNVAVIYQTSEKNSKNEEYHARSFEDAFFHLNRQFVIDNKSSFRSLRNISHFEKDENDAYFLAENCIDKKPSFAMEILLNSKTKDKGDEFTNWETPAYIKEGLLWLKNN